jgi:thioredoxin 1
MNLNHPNKSLRFVSDADFKSRVQFQDALLVAFWAPWSKPCDVIDPVLMEVARGCAGRVEVVKVNADDNPNLSLWFGVQHVPTILYFEAGELQGQLVGTVTRDAILGLVAQQSDAARGKDPENGKAV